MIRTIEVKGLRALRYVNVSLSPFHVLVGPNASGKSTFFDVLLLARDLLTVGPKKAVFGDARLDIAQRAWDPADLSWMRTGSRVEIAITADLPGEIQARLPKGHTSCRYEFALCVAPEVGLENETLWLCKEADSDVRKSAGPRELFPAPPAPPETIVSPTRSKAPKGWLRVVNKIGETGNDYFAAETSGWKSPFRLGPDKSALANLPEDEVRFPAAIWFKRLLMEGIHRLVLEPEAMRLPCRPGIGHTYLPDGSNLPWVIHALERDHPDALREWTEHVRTALPDVKSVTTIERSEDRHRYFVMEYENGLKAPSWIVSDGTLRLLALTLLAYSPSRPRIVLVEEPENGIHPQAVETVFQSLSGVYDGQVFCATHSPVLLALTRSDQLLCFGRSADGAVDIVRGDEHPRLLAWKEVMHLGDLFAAGVLS